MQIFFDRRFADAQNCCSKYGKTIHFYILNGEHGIFKQFISVVVGEHFVAILQQSLIFLSSLPFVNCNPARVVGCNGWVVYFALHGSSPKSDQHPCQTCESSFSIWFSQCTNNEIIHQKASQKNTTGCSNKFRTSNLSKDTEQLSFVKCISNCNITPYGVFAEISPIVWCVDDGYLLSALWSSPYALYEGLALLLLFIPTALVSRRKSLLVIHLSRSI